MITPSEVYDAAVGQINSNKDCGVPDEGVMYMLVYWFVDLMKFDVADPLTVREAIRRLEDDKIIEVDRELMRKHIVYRTQADDLTEGELSTAIANYNSALDPIPCDE